MNENDETRTANNPPPDDATRDAAESPPAEGTASQLIGADTFLKAIGLVAGDTAVAPTSGPLVGGPPVSVPGYEIVRELGRGGMGVVYEAQQSALNRTVALKMVLRGANVSPAERARFRAEAEAVAAIKHPHVVQVFEFGEHDGLPFFAMEFLAGGSFADRVKIGPIPPRETAMLLEKIARGVAAAHALDIVHRDLKPGNVVFDETGTPRVTDFGLAKRAGGDLTQTGAIMGSAHYMSPEQAGGRTKFVGPPADVWALGVMLYECLTGKRPFDADTTNGVLSQVLMDEPARPRKVLASIPRDAELVCLKCLEKDPADRYPTATELADDLRRLAGGEPVSVRAAGLVERLTKWARRKPTAAAAWGFSGLAALLAVVVLVITGSWREAKVARDKLNEAFGNETEAKKQVQGLLATESELRGQLQLLLKAKQGAMEQLEWLRYGQTMLLTHQAWRDNDLFTARRFLTETREDLRGWEYHYIHRLCHADLFRFSGHEGDVTSASFSQDGTRIVTASEDKSARVWDTKTGAELVVLRGHEKSVLSASFSSEGTRVVTTSDDKTVRVWDAKSGTAVTVLRGHTEGAKASFSPDGTRVVTTSEDKTARVWDARTGAEVAVLQGHAAKVPMASFSPDGTRVVTASEDKTARVWNARTGAEVVVLKGHTDGVQWASFGADGTRVLTTSRDRSARVWDAQTGDQVVALDRETIGVSAWFSPDGTRVVTDWGNYTMRVWNTKTGAQVAMLEGHRGEVNTVSFSADGSRFVTASSDRTARVWDTRTGDRVAVLRGHESEVHLASLSPNGSRVVTVGGRSARTRPTDRLVPGPVRLWDITSETERVTLNHDFDWCLALSSDGSRVVTAGEKGKALVRESKTGRPVAELKGHEESVVSASFSHDGALVLTKCSHTYIGRNGFSSSGPCDGTVRVWDARTGASVVVLGGFKTGVTSAAFSPDGARIVTGEHDGTVRVWDVKTGTAVTVLRGHTGVVNSASFSRDGTRVVTSGNDGTVWVWDVKTGTAVTELHSPDHFWWPIAAAFSPDGSRIVAGSTDGMVRMWEVNTGTVVAGLRGHTGGVNSVTFSPDGLRVMTGAADDTVRVWDAKTGVEVARLQAQASVLTVTFSPDGSRIIAGIWGNSIHIWDSTPINREFIPKPVAPAPRAR